MKIKMKERDQLLEAKNNENSKSHYIGSLGQKLSRWRIKYYKIFEELIKIKWRKYKKKIR